MIKRILAISNHGTMLGGGEYSFLDLLTHLSDEWKTIAIVPHEGELSKRLSLDGIETHVIPLQPVRYWSIHRNIFCLKSYFRAGKEHRPDLIYANGSRAALYGGLIGKLLRVPVIWHCRIADKDPYLDLILLCLSNAVIANSHATARRFSTSVQHKVKIVHNGIDLKWLTDPSVTSPQMVSKAWKVIVCVARVSRWKRHEIVLRAYEKVAIEEPDAHLFFIGGKDVEEAEWWDHLQKMTNLSEYSNRIHWIGNLSDVRPWYKVADILTLGSDNEPFGRVIVEAMACGVPIVATRSGGIPEIVRDGEDGILVKPGDSEEMADAMLKILKNETLRKKASKNAQERAQYFSLDFHVDKMSQIFQEIADEENRH